MLRTALTAIALLAAAAPINSEPVTNSVIVRYGDLDLKDRADVAKLRHRIYEAVVVVCGDPVPTTRDIEADVLHCRHQALKDANSAAIVAVNEARRQSDYAAADLMLPSR